MIGLLILLSISTVYGESAVDCSFSGDGHFEIGCKSYVICNSGVKSFRECGIGEVYNNDTNGCFDDSKVGPPCGLKRDCSIKPNRKYSDKELGCHSYYTCQNGHYYGHNYCSPGTVFDEAMQLCNWPVNVVPPCGSASQ